jgi:hypothetical protein
VSREVCCDHPQNGRTKTIGVSVILFTLGSGMGRRAATSFSLFTSVSFLVGAFIASVAGARGDSIATSIRSSPAEKTGRRTLGCSRAVEGHGPWRGDVPLARGSCSPASCGKAVQSAGQSVDNRRCQ